MRGRQPLQQSMLLFGSIEERIPADHPLRALRMLVDEILRRLSPTFDEMYAQSGRPSIPPEHLLKALLLQRIYTIRSERQLIEHLRYNLLYRWFVGLAGESDVWDDSTFSKNRDRLEMVELEDRFLAEVVKLADEQGLLSHAHFTVDGTLLEAAASLKSFRPKDEPRQPPSTPTDGRNPSVDFHGETRTNETHASTTDPEARLARKGNGKEAKLSFQGSVLMENRHGLIVDTDVRSPSGRAEVEAAADLLIGVAPPPDQRKTVGADKGYDTAAFVADARTLGFTPQVAQKRKGSAIDGRTTHPLGYAISQEKRKLVEQGFGWGKTIGGLRKLLHRGTRRVAGVFALACAAYDLIRIRNLLAEATP
jgi:transposase